MAMVLDVLLSNILLIGAVMINIKMVLKFSC